MSCFVRQKIVGAVLAGLIVGSGSLRASSESSAIIDILSGTFGIELSDQALETLQQSLGSKFSQQFRSRASLTPEAIQNYIREHPSELLAFRAYSQRLHDSGYLSYEESMNLVRSAFIGFSENT